MNYAGYEFVKVGSFKLSDKPLEVTWNKKPCKISVELKLLNENIKKVGESFYLVVCDDAPLYVGEYSKTLGERWFRKDDYIWHGKDDDILELLKNGGVVDFYLIKGLVATLPNGKKLNVAKSIEHDILQHYPPEWNKRNKNLDLTGVMTLSEALSL